MLFLFTQGSKGLTTLSVSPPPSPPPHTHIQTHTYPSILFFWWGHGGGWSDLCESLLFYTPRGWGRGGLWVAAVCRGGEGWVGCWGGRQQMACHTVRAVGWHPEEEEEEGGEGGEGGGGGVQRLEGHCSQSASRHQERERQRWGALVGDRLVDRQTGRNPQTLRLELKQGLGAGFWC